MKHKLMTLIAGGLLSSLIGETSMATPQVPSLPAAMAAPGVSLELVATKKVTVKNTTQKRHGKTTRTVRYSKSTHGARFTTRRPGYSYYHGGYWYSRPWWAGLPGVIIVLP